MDSPPPNDRPLRQVACRGRHVVVDIHAHLGVRAAAAAVGPANAAPPEILRFSCPATDTVNRTMFEQIGDTLNGVDQRLRDMDRLGVDVQALSPSPGQYFYHVDEELGAAAATLVNDGIAAAVAAHPERFVGMGTLPMQNVELALRELRRCVSDLDLRGIEIGTNVAGRDLGDDAFTPIWSEAERLGLLVFLHPLGFTSADRMRDHYLNNLIGNPLESSLAISHLIFGGVLDRHPGLKICVAHGGGFLPSYWGRLDHGWRARDDCRAGCRHAPSTYIRRLFLDTLVFDRDQLDALVRNHGAEHLCLGSDYPFDMSEPDPVGFHDHLPEPARAAIIGSNAARLLGLVPVSRVSEKHKPD